MPSFSLPCYWCEWGWPGGDHFPRWTPGNTRELQMWHGWPARAGAGSSPGSESATRAEGCSSWRHKPSEECPGSQWCWPLPPTGSINDLQCGISLSIWGSILHLKCIRHLTDILTVQFNVISVLHIREVSWQTKSYILLFYMALECISLSLVLQRYAGQM